MIPPPGVYLGRRFDRCCSLMSTWCALGVGTAVVQGIPGALLGNEVTRTVHIATPRSRAMQATDRAVGGERARAHQAWSGPRGRWQTGCLRVPMRARAYHRRMSDKDVHDRIMGKAAKTGSVTIVEEAAVPERGVQMLHKGTPEDYKVYVLGRDILAIAMIRRTAGQKCGTWRDAYWSPLPAPDVGQVFDTCDPKTVPRPRHLRELVRNAAQLGAALGVHYRIDFYMTPKGPVLGEFTPWGAEGDKGAMDATWSCRFGRFWRGQEGAGDHLPGPPPGFEAFRNMTLLNQCKFVQRQQAQHIINHSYS